MQYLLDRFLQACCSECRKLGAAKDGYEAAMVNGSEEGGSFLGNPACYSQLAKTTQAYGSQKYLANG